MAHDFTPKAVKEYNELTKELESNQDRNRITQIGKRLKELEPLRDAELEVIRWQDEHDQWRSLAIAESDPVTKKDAEKQRDEAEEKYTEAIVSYLKLSVPRDPNDDKSAIIELRAGAGGDEASLFAGDLFGMYSKFAEKHGWTVDLLSSSRSEAGGFKEAVFEVKGSGAFGAFKFEGGTHRVQRIPVTESGGRIHTSTATVAVLPEAEEVELDIKPDELRIDVFRSSGPGGQSVNTTDSAVRITHLPSGLVVTCQDEKSQHKNRDRAMVILRARLKAAQEEAAAQERGDERRSQVGTGDRSEKIRTYNVPQDRITDHRIKLTVPNVSKVLGGELDAIIEALAKAERDAREQAA